MDGLMENGIETGSGRVLWYSSVPGLEDLIFTEPIVRHRLILLTPLSLSLSLSHHFHHHDARLVDWINFKPND